MFSSGNSIRPILGWGILVDDQDAFDVVPAATRPLLERICTELSQILSGRPTAGPLQSETIALCLRIAERKEDTKVAGVSTDPVRSQELYLDLDFTGLRQDPFRLECDAFNARDWTPVEQYINHHGYRVVVRGPSSRVGIADTPLTPIVEVRNERGDVVAEGKGWDEPRSRASAMAEAVERLVARASRHDVIASRNDLGKSALGFAQLDLGPRDILPDDLVTDWTQVHCLSGAASYYVPSELVWPGHVPSTGIVSIGHRSTSGLAAGWTYEDAVANGLLELVERDAYWTVMRCRVRCPAMHLNPAPDWLTQIRDQCRLQGLSLHVLDISQDAPVFVAHALIEGESAPAFAHGAGAAFTRDAAVARAVSEAAQVRSDMAVFLQANPRVLADPEMGMSMAAALWSDPLARPHISHLLEDPSRDPCATAGLMSSSPSTVADLVDFLGSRGILVYWRSLGEVGGLKVVRVLAPGLTVPDLRIERISKRLEAARVRTGNSHFYFDPILT